MTPQENIVPNLPTDSNNEVLQGLLEFVSKQLDKQKSKVDLSMTMLSSGAKTEYVTLLENILNNPIEELSKYATKADDLAKSFINLTVKGFLKGKENLISSAVRTETISNDLHYTLSLKDDSSDNRDMIFDFLSTYELLPFADKYPVFFQIIPEELKEEMPIAEEII